MNPISLYVQISPLIAISATPGGYPVVAEQNGTGEDVNALGVEQIYYQDSPLVLRFSGPVSLEAGTPMLLAFIEYVLSHGGSVEEN